MGYSDLFVDKQQILIVNKNLVMVLGNLNEAIVLNQVNYWIERNKERGQNFVNGRTWVYNSYQNWMENDFPFWSIDTIKRTFKKLEEKGIILSENYNSHPMDKTKWYTIDYEKLEELLSKTRESQTESNVSANCTDEDSRLNQAIPENTNKDYSTQNTYGEPIGSHCKRHGAEPETVQHSQSNPKRKIDHDYFVDKYKRIADTDFPGVDGLDRDVEKLSCISSIFFDRYRENMGVEHSDLTCAGYRNVLYNFLKTDEMLADCSLEDYETMIDKYFNTDYNQRGKYGSKIELSLSHFMSGQIREHLFYSELY